MSPADRLWVKVHYTRGDLEERLLDALATAGVAVDDLSPEDLGPVDAFHVRGREATRELAELTGFTAGQRVIDIGCGLGGTARFLASRYGVMVTGLDLTREYCRVGTVLNELTGLTEQVELRAGNALELPFPPGSFARAWTEHAAMNVADKARLYAEVRRVLLTRGRFALYDVVQGQGGDVRFPVPWAAQPEISFLASPDELRGLLEEHRFRVVEWRDVSDAARAWLRARVAALEDGAAPTLGVHLLLGPDADEMLANMLENLEHDRIRLVQAVAEAV